MAFAWPNLPLRDLDFRIDATFALGIFGFVVGRVEVDDEVERLRDVAGEVLRAVHRHRRNYLKVKSNGVRTTVEGIVQRTLTLGGSISLQLVTSWTGLDSL